VNASLGQFAAHVQHVILLAVIFRKRLLARLGPDE
jgi:hypothetical protein